MSNWIKCEKADKQPIYLNFDAAISVEAFTPSAGPDRTRVSFPAGGDRDLHVEILDPLETIATALRK